MTRERAAIVAAVLVAGEEARRCERMVEACLDMALHWTERAEAWRARLHRAADIVDAGARAAGYVVDAAAAERVDANDAMAARLDAHRHAEREQLEGTREGERRSA